jgi:hypothetical protein
MIAQATRIRLSPCNSIALLFSRCGAHQKLRLHPAHRRYAHQNKSALLAAFKGGDKTMIHKYSKEAVALLKKVKDGEPYVVSI